MSVTIYFFSGTGNSLAVARDIAAGLGGAELVSIAAASNQDPSPETDCVGIVFPVYAWGPPALVTRFLDEVDLGSSKYVFAVCTCGGWAGGTLGHVESRLRKRGITLSSGFKVAMPSNYIVWSGAIPKEKQKAMFAKAHERVAQICEIVRGRKIQRPEKGSFAGRLITDWIHKHAMRSFFFKQDRKFSVGETCNGCSACEKICPAKDIEMVNGEPRWLGRCEQCMACIQWCPQEAIQIGRKTVGRKRYRHPEVNARDLMAKDGIRDNAE